MFLDSLRIRAAHPLHVSRFSNRLRYSSRFFIPSARILLATQFPSRTMSSFTPWIPIQRPYPTPRRSDHVDVYKSESKGDVRVPDPYNWLEKKSEETDKWIAAQEAFTAAYLDQNSDRKALEEEIRANTNFPKVRVPSRLVVILVLSVASRLKNK